MAADMGRGLETSRGRKKFDVGIIEQVLSWGSVGSISKPIIWGKVANTLKLFGNFVYFLI